MPAKATAVPKLKATAVAGKVGILEYNNCMVMGTELCKQAIPTAISKILSCPNCNDMMAIVSEIYTHLFHPILSAINPPMIFPKKALIPTTRNPYSKF